MVDIIYIFSENDCESEIHPEEWKGRLIFKNELVNKAIDYIVKQQRCRSEFI